MSRTRPFLRMSLSVDTVALAGGGIVSGLAAYAFTVLGLRVFGPVAFAPVAVLWSLWALAVAGVSFPLQHWIIQAVRGARSDEPLLRRRLSLIAVVVAVSVLAGLATWAGRHSLFGSSAWLYPVAASGIVVTAGLSGYVRGVLGSRGRFGALSGSVVADGTLRLLLAVAIVIAGLGVGGLALAIPIASLVVVLWSSTFRLSASGHEMVGRPVRSGPGALAGSFLVLHLLLNAPPVVAAAIGAEPDVVSSLFAAFALFRAPFLLMSVLGTKVSYLLATNAAEGQVHRLTRFRHAVAAATAGGFVIGGLLGGTPALWALQLVYGPEVSLATLEGRLILSGSVAAVGVLMLMLLVSARGASSSSLVPLLAGTAGSAAWVVLASPLDPGLRVSSGFLVGVVTVLLGLLWADRGLVARRSCADGEQTLPSTGGFGS